MRAADPVTFDLRIAELHVRLRFAGSGLVPLVVPAFGHVRAAPTEATSEPDLMVELWDAQTTGVAAPRFPWRTGDLGPRGEVTALRDVGVHAIFHGGAQSPDEDFTALTIFDPRRSIVRFYVPAPGRVPQYERAAPLRAALHLALSGSRRMLVHAAAVAIGGRGVLLAGAGGVGKSTTAVAAALGGFDYLGDDYVVVDLGASRPEAHSLYCTAKLDPRAAAWFPALPPAAPAAPADGEKQVIIDIRQMSGADRPGRAATLAAIVLPRMAPGAATRLRPVSRGEALLGLAPSTIFQAPRRDRASLARLAELVRRVPVFGLDLGGHPTDALPALAGLLEP